MPEYKPARFRRMLAWFLDLGICLMLPARLVTVLPLSANVQIFAAAFVIFGGLAAFSCRDYLLGLSEVMHGQGSLGTWPKGTRCLNGSRPLLFPFLT